ncbi:hypothetical protein EOM09_07160 [bacterium]|nr:hypothetical protein [bacterium]
MKKTKKEHIEFIIKIIRSMHQQQIEKFTKKVENIEHLHIESLISRIEGEIPASEWKDNYNKIISLIEDLLED